MTRAGMPVAVLFVLVALAAGCAPKPPQALGTLEYERVTLPAPAADRIVEIPVREGQAVKAGQTVLRLERTRLQAATQAAQAQAQVQREALAELEAGPRTEAIAQARAQAAGAQISRHATASPAAVRRAPI